MSKERIQPSSESEPSQPDIRDQQQYWNTYMNPGYRPTHEILDSDEIRSPFWGIANHVLREFYDVKR